MKEFLTNFSWQVFSEGFPTDFSIITVLKSSKDFSRVPVFSIYNQESEETLVLYVGSEIAVVYQDTQGNLNDDSLISFEANTNDLEWHRIGISFKGDSVTVIFDCSKQITKKLPRSANPKLATDGLVFMGVQLDEEEEYFMVTSKFDLVN